MPSHLVHFYIDRIFFGRTYPKIHRAMDAPYKVVGRHHRMYFHDQLTACLIAEKYYPGDENAVVSAFLHIQYDEMCSKDPEYRKYIEGQAQLGNMQRRKERKRTQPARQRSKAEKASIRDMKKMEEIWRLWKQFHSPPTRTENT